MKEFIFLEKKLKMGGKKIIVGEGNFHKILLNKGTAIEYFSILPLLAHSLNLLPHPNLTTPSRRHPGVAGRSTTPAKR